MSVKHRLRTILCCGILEVAALMGVPMRPSEIQDLMHSLNQPKTAQTNPDETGNSDAPDPGRPPEQAARPPHAP